MEGAEQTSALITAELVLMIIPEAYKSRLNAGRKGSVLSIAESSAPDR